MEIKKGIVIFLSALSLILLISILTEKNVTTPTKVIQLPEEVVDEIIEMAIDKKKVARNSNAYLKSKAKKTVVINNEITAIQVLNKGEGFYSIPYWDNKQYSVGYGSFIDYKDCKIIWKRMKISEVVGKAIAWRIHSLTNTRNGYKKVMQICNTFKNHKGCLTEKEACILRNKELNKFYVLVNGKFPNLPSVQKQVLTCTVYNTGWFGFIGGKSTHHTIPKSALCSALEKHHYFSKPVYTAYTKLKICSNGKFNKGLLRRRCLERDQFMANKDIASLTAFTERYNNF